jgi:hypothetical protein
MDPRIDEGAALGGPTTPSTGVFIALGAAGAGEESQGLIWKEILHPGTVFKRNSGRRIEITPDVVRTAYEAFKAGLPKLVSVPTTHHHHAFSGVVPPEENRGFVRDLKITEDNRLYAGFEFTKEATRQGVLDGSIADVSVFLQPNVTHPATGDRYDWALLHVLLTNDPNMTDLGGWGEAIAAEATDGQAVDIGYYVYEGKSQVKEEGNMPEEQDVLTLSGEDRAYYEAIVGLGLSADEIEALAAQRETLAKRTRDLEITNIVIALEGKEEHELVTQVEGTRHYPAVIKAVEEALTQEPIALSADEQGRADVDALVLAVVNAIPKEGRLALTGTDGPAGNKDPEPPAGDGPEKNKEAPSPEQVDALLEKTGA